MYDIGRGLCWALDAVPFAEDRLGFVPDAWQAQLLRSRSQWILLNCCRQSGKSTTTAIVALHQAIYDPGLVLCVSPSLRQSRELFAKVIGFLKSIEPVIPLEEDNKSSCELSNGSRIVSLPGDPDTVRGYSAPKLVITDEAAYVSDAMQAAIAPMLAVSQGRQIDMSSPSREICLIPKAGGEAAPPPNRYDATMLPMPVVSGEPKVTTEAPSSRRRTI